MPGLFDATCLAEGQAAFAWPVQVDPLKSIPGAVPYTSQGVFTSQHMEITMADGSILSDQSTFLSIRVADYPIKPEVGDRLTVYDPDVWPDQQVIIGQYWVGDHHEDGQGKVQLQLRFIKPEPLP